MPDLSKSELRRLEFQARKIEQLELVIASQLNLINLLQSQFCVHTESTLLLQRRFRDACFCTPAATMLADPVNATGPSTGASSDSIDPIDVRFFARTQGRGNAVCASPTTLITDGHSFRVIC